MRLVLLLLLVLSFSLQATLIVVSHCTGANACTVTNHPPLVLSPDPNDGLLLAWDELQNYTLTQDLLVDRVFDTNTAIIGATNNGSYFIKAGTVVSSHYLQWDPGMTAGQLSSATVSAQIQLDSQVFAFITADQNLFDSDYLGLPNIDYNDFGSRELEDVDTTYFDGTNVDINWTADSAGHWTRLITAFSPSADLITAFSPSIVSVYEPKSFMLLAFCILFLLLRKNIASK